LLPADRRNWDAIVVGAGHNGLTCAAYLARGGLQTLVLEARARLGGACTLTHPFPDERYVISPCAYVVGLLHQHVVHELDLPRHGYRVQLIDPHLWCPFENGTSLTLWDSADKNSDEVARLSAADVDGYLHYERLFAQIRHLLRTPPHDVWLGDAPDHEQVAAALHYHGDLIDVMFNESIADVVERNVSDERLRTALHGQGLIGTWAGPRDPGTASIHALHSMGTIERRGGAWGYVEGGMGMVSVALAAAAREAGAVIVESTRVCAIEENAVLLEDGTRLGARAVISNADPMTTLDLCGGIAPEDFGERVATWRMEGPVIKLNCALHRLPRFTAARPGEHPERAMVTIARSIDETQAAFERSRTGVPAPVWAELYFQSAYDPTVAPPGRHVMSVFAQYAPYRLAGTTWDIVRESVADSIIAEIERFAPDIAECIEYRQVLAPPDIEREVGLRGGHIFQGECLPDQMWDRRFSPRTSIDGVYMCGAATHPGGSVIAANGRNAAMAVIADLRRE
jgi:phytoene dehydrogenase-like protein